MYRICLVVLLGLPAAGKTTFCEYMLQMGSVPCNILHLCYDYLIDFNSESQMLYKFQRENVLKCIKAITTKFKTFHFPSEIETMKIQYQKHQNNDVLILCDDNNYYRSMRYKLFQFARDNSLGFCQIYFKCDLELVLERNSLRSSSLRVPDDVIVQMYNRFDVPNGIANAWEEHTLVLKNQNPSKHYYNEIVCYILQFLDKPVPSLQLTVPKAKTPQSKVHELDLLMRKRIQKIMNETQKQNKTLLAKNLNEKRKTTLKRFEVDMNNKLHDNLDLNKYVESLSN